MSKERPILSPVLPGAPDRFTRERDQQDLFWVRAVKKGHFLRIAHFEAVENGAIPEDVFKKLSGLGLTLPVPAAQFSQIEREEREAVEGLLGKYRPLIEITTRKLISQNIFDSTLHEEDDVKSIVTNALVELAIEYDEERSIFKTYTNRYLLPRSIDGLREEAHWERAPKSVGVGNVLAYLQEHGLSFTTVNIIFAIAKTEEAINPQDVEKALFVRGSRQVFLSEELPDQSVDGELAFADVITTGEDEAFLGALVELNKGLVVKILNSPMLDARAKIVIYFYYFQGMTMTEIGETLNITESRVSQIHGKALKKMKQALGSDSSLAG